MSSTPSSRTPRPGAAIALFAAVLVANLALGLLASSLELDENVLLFLTPAAVLLLTAGAVVFFRVDARETLLLKLPSKADLAMAFPLSISFIVLSDQLSSLTQEIFPISEDVIEGWTRMIRATTPGEWVSKIASIGAGAAVSEELLFRGFIQSALLNNMSRTGAVFWTAFLFMVLHILPLPTYAAAGLVLGVTALSTRSIVVPIVVHFTNNMAALVLVNFAGIETFGDPVWIPPSILLPALAIFALTMGFYLRRLIPDPEVPPEPEPPAAGGRAELPSPSLVDELATLPLGRRRLGWLVVVFAVLIGIMALMGLIVYSVYWTEPRAANAAVIETLERECQSRLSTSALARSDELESAFDALSAANETGALELSALWRVIVAYARASGDGSIDGREVDDLLGAIASVVGEATLPRRLD